MAENKDVLMMQAFRAFSQGCGTAEVDDQACAWFHDRYHPWITARKAVGTSPEEVWAEHGKDFLGRFREMGQKAAASGAVSSETLRTTAEAVERDSDCPWCPIKEDA